VASSLDAGLLSTPSSRELATLFRSHHREHAELFERTTADLGGRPFADPNPAVMQKLQPALDGLGDEDAALRLTYDVETILADTYQATMGAFADKSFNVAAMSVGGAEARHAAALAQSLGLGAALQAFVTPDRAVPAGGGV
jgi:hypothetical protein